VQQVTVTKKWMEEAQQRAAEVQQQAIERLAKQRRPNAPVVKPVVEEQRPIQVGDAVFVPSVNMTGDVVEVDTDDDQAIVQVGGFRITVKLSEVRPGQRKEPTVQVQRQTYVPSTPDVAIEIDVRGMRAAEAIERVDRYIDDAYRASLPFVRIIHGKGSGALRQTLRDQLQRHRQVKSLAGGGASGGEGVTVVHLNEH
jgi:DNA mismatch repair protein MutS2